MTVRHRLEIMITRAQQVHSSACALNNCRPLHVTHFAAGLWRILVILRAPGPARVCTPEPPVRHGRRE